jgi:hypothetical protein
VTDACWYCRRPGEFLCDFQIGSTTWPDRCEWDPTKGEPRHEDEGCTERATQIVGADGYVRVCDGCAAAPQLKRRRARKPIDPKARRPVTCDAAACRRCAARFGWRTVMSAIVCVRSGKGRGCHDAGVHHCHVHARSEELAVQAPTGEELKSLCAALFAEPGPAVIHRDTKPAIGRRHPDRWRENSKLFIDELRKGRHWQEWAAKELKFRGLQVELPAYSERAAIEDVDRWTMQDQDLVVRGSAVGDCVLEVKSRPLYFIDPPGYPYPTALVDTVDGWNAKAVEPRAVLLVSQPAKRILVISAATKREWLVKRARDRFRNTEADFYECPRGRLASLEWLVSKLLP